MAFSVWLAPSVWVLIAANLIPVGGVLLLGWGVFDVLLLYWTENVVIGGFNVLRMLVVRPAVPALWLGKLVSVPFFMVHYGMFTAVHGFFLVALFQDVAGSWGVSGTTDEQALFAVVASVIDRPGALIAVGSLLVSHGVSFAVNYIGRGEYRKSSLQGVMMQPYARVVVMHVTIIGMGFLVVLTGTRVAGLLLLVVLKIGVDVAAHVNEHAKLAKLSP